MKVNVFLIETLCVFGGEDFPFPSRSQNRDPDTGTLNSRQIEETGEKSEDNYDEGDEGEDDAAEEATSDKPKPRNAYLNLLDKLAGHSALFF